MINLPSQCETVLENAMKFSGSKLTSKYAIYIVFVTKAKIYFSFLVSKSKVGGVSEAPT